MPKGSAKQTKTNGSAAIIVFGLDSKRKPRAGYFGEAQAKLAVKAAKTLGFHAMSVETAAHRALAERLDAGRVHASGDGLIPSVRRPVFKQLMAAGGTGESGEEASQAHAGEPVARGVPANWDEIEAGHLVLAQENARDGWWEAIVIQREGDVFKLRWRDYPRLPAFTRPRAALALTCPVSV